MDTWELGSSLTSFSQLSISKLSGCCPSWIYLAAYSLHAPEIFIPESQNIACLPHPHHDFHLKKQKYIDKSQSISLRWNSNVHITALLFFPVWLWQDDCDPDTGVDTRMTQAGDGSPGGGRCLSWSSLESDPQTQTLGHVQGWLWVWLSPNFLS